MASIVSKPNGTFLVRWRVGGRGSRMVSRSFKTHEEAEEFAQQMDAPRAYQEIERKNRKQFERGEMSPEAAHFLGYTNVSPAPEERWSVAGYIREMTEADHELRPTTRSLYLRNLRIHIEGTDFGRADIREVQPEQIAAWWKKLKAGVGARRNVQQLVSKAFNRAVIAGDRGDNPLRRAPEVKRPKPGRQEEVQVLSVRQIEALANAAREPRRGEVGPVGEMARWRDRLEILVMAYAGLRAGEVGGLRERDVHRKGDRCELRLEQQVVRETGKPPYATRLKTDAARRRVAIPCSLADEIRDFLREHPPAPDGRVFHGPNGEPLAHNNVNHAVVSAGRRIDLDVNAHQLRHTAVSLLIDEGANPNAIRAFVGHTDIRMTLGVYGHLFDQGGAALADIMERLRDDHRNGVLTRTATQTSRPSRRGSVRTGSRNAVTDSQPPRKRRKSSRGTDP